MQWPVIVHAIFACTFASFPFACRRGDGARRLHGGAAAAWICTQCEKGKIDGQWNTQVLMRDGVLLDPDITTPFAAEVIALDGAVEALLRLLNENSARDL